MLEMIIDNYKFMLFSCNEGDYFRKNECSIKIDILFILI